MFCYCHTKHKQSSFMKILNHVSIFSMYVPHFTQYKATTYNVQQFIKLSPSDFLSSGRKMEAVHFYKMLVITYKTTRCHKLQDHNLSAHHHKSFKCHKLSHILLLQFIMQETGCTSSSIKCCATTCNLEKPKISSLNRYKESSINPHLHRQIKELQ
jgi:hypothetical protein